MLSRIIWTLLAAACLIWYATITILVAWKGGSDIKKMLTKLGAGRDAANDHAGR